MTIDSDFFDKQFFSHGPLIGCDEVGRGPLAGPVVACSVMVESSHTLDFLRNLGIMDSKKISNKKRREILKSINVDITKLDCCIIYKINDEISFSLEEISPAEIDEINILQASLKAMRVSAERLSCKLESGQIIIDGNKVFPAKLPTQSVVKGDSKSLVIGLASILAKEFRDEKMKSYDKAYPGYFFSDHAGYPTVKHREAIAKNGISPIHRKSFKGVKEFI